MRWMGIQILTAGLFWSSHRAELASRRGQTRSIPQQARRQHHQPNVQPIRLVLQWLHPSADFKADIARRHSTPGYWRSIVLITTNLRKYI